MRLLKRTKGFTLVEVLVGVFLITLVFFGIFGAYRLGLKVVYQSERKVVATALANAEIEKIRNLPYESIGVIGSFPDGSLNPSFTVSVGGVIYQVETRVDFEVDPADGLASPQDDCPNDYKKVAIIVSWSGVLEGRVSLISDIAPKDISQECATGGGILSVSVFNAFGVMVSFPSIEIKDPNTDQVVKTANPASGKHLFALATGTYKVVSSKIDYSTERTYSMSEVTTPLNPNPIVLEDQLTEVSFSIDRLSSFMVNTLSPWGSGYYSDSFLNKNKISEKADLIVSAGEVTLASSTAGFLSSGHLVSTDIVPSSLIHWEELSFSDSKPFNTNIKYQIYYASGTEWYLIPNSDLNGNSSGFSLSPVDLSGLSVSPYSRLRLKANFSTNDSSSTPILYDWQVSWINSNALPIPNVAFHLRGAKIIGKDAANNPVYKYSQDHASNGSGQKEILSLEWDTYTFSLGPFAGLDLIDTNPKPQPISLAPDTSLNTDLYLESQNSLLITLQDLETLEPVFSATTAVSNAGLGYNTTQYTNAGGQTKFIPLDAATYEINIQMNGYLSTTTSATVSGHNRKTIKIEKVE